MKMITAAALLVAALGVAARPASAGCDADRDCKGDRICDDGRCVSPSAGRGGSEEDADAPSGGRGSRRRLPSYCCTPAGRLGPYANPSVPEGGSCFGTHPMYGPVYGRACY